MNFRNPLKCRIPSIHLRSTWRIFWFTESRILTTLGLTCLKMESDHLFWVEKIGYFPEAREEQMRQLFGILSFKHSKRIRKITMDFWNLWKGLQDVKIQRNARFFLENPSGGIIRRLLSIYPTFIVIFRSICVFTKISAIKWLHTLIGNTQLFLRTGIWT